MAKKDDKEILTRDDVLELLSMKAAEGSVTAMVCLERALRHQPPDPDELDEELERCSAGRNERGTPQPVREAVPSPLLSWLRGALQKCRFARKAAVSDTADERRLVAALPQRDA